MKPLAASPGFTLIEILVVVAVLGIVLMIGLPNMSAWLQNTQIRNAAESASAGLQLARAEALRRNAAVRFSLVDTLTSSCALSATGTNWVVSLATPGGACQQAPSDTTAPQIVQKKSGAEGATNVWVSATGGSDVVFNGLGRTVGAGNLTQIDFSNPSGGACKTTAGNEPMRCLRVTVSSGGQVRMCDPAVTDNTDPRFC